MSRELGKIMPGKQRTERASPSRRALANRIEIVDTPVRFYNPAAENAKLAAEPFSTFLADAKERSRRAINTERQRVRTNRKAWPLYDSGIENYETAFVKVWKVFNESFESFLSRRREQTGRVLVLDVMGTGGFVPRYSVDGEAAMTLVDHRPKKIRDRDSALGKEVIEGDVLGMDSWRKARRFLDAHDAPGFDLVTCIPRAGLNVLRGRFVTKNVNTDLADWTFAQRMYGLLHPHGGTLLDKMHTFVDYSAWYNRLNYTPGLETQIPENNFGALRITRNPEAPKFLPRI